MAAAVLSTILMPLGAAYEELELQAATDALAADGFATLDHVFWRSSFGAPLIGGPTFAGNITDYDAFRTQTEAWSGGAFPTGALPVFMEYAALSDPTYTGNGSDADYAEQRWNFTASARVVGAASLGTGAAAQAVWARELLRTNHDANGTQDPDGPLVGASDDAGLMGLFLVQAIHDRVTAVAGGAAYNGSALQAFNLTDPALTDDNTSNGWQLVPDAMAVTISGSTFQGFVASDNASSLAGQAALVLGLAEVVGLSDPAGDLAGLFDGSPFDDSLYNESRALLGAVAQNAHAYHWNATAGTYTEPDRASVDTGDLALFARALAVGESATGSDTTLQGQLGDLREQAVEALLAMAGAGGRYAATFTVNGTAVTPDFAAASLWAQAQAVEALEASAAATGLKADFDAGLRAAAGLESALYRDGSFAAEWPEPALTSYTGAAVAGLVGALRDLSLTGEEPLAVYRFVDAFDTLVAAPPLLLSSAQGPPVVGASFTYNTTNATASAATDFDAVSAMLASYEFASTGARYNAAVGGGVLVTESAAERLHNATAAEVGTVIDSLDQQILDLQAQLAVLQAAFDAINSTASDIEDRLNLSLENESISQGRIQDLMDNVSTLRVQLNQSHGERDNATALWENISRTLNETRQEVANLTVDLAAAQNATSVARGDLNRTLGDLKEAEDGRSNTQGELDARGEELTRVQGLTAIGVIVGIVAGFGLFYVINRFVMSKPLARGGSGGKGKDDEGDS